MSHLHTEKGGHDLTVSAHIIRTDTAEPTVMLHKHKKLGRYLQFGGHVEHNENPWEAITHELAEESGYHISQLEVLQPMTRLKSLTGVRLHPVPVSYLTHEFPGLDHYHTDTAFAFVTDQPPKGEPQEDESVDIELFTADEIRAIHKDDIYPNVREIALFVLETSLSEWVRVPTSSFA